MDTSPLEIDIGRKYVRPIVWRDDGFVEFEFAIGEPELCAELLLPADAFEAFCRSHAVTHLPPREASAAGDGDGRSDRDDSVDSDWRWSLHQATHQRFR